MPTNFQFSSKSYPSEMNLYWEGVKYYTPNIFADSIFLTVIGESFEVEEFYDGVKYAEEVTHVLALIELEHNPANNNEVWLKYISVREGHQGKGYASKVLQMLVEYMKTLSDGHYLHRSTTSPKAPEHIASVIDSKLNAAGVKWSQQRGECLVKNY